MKKTIFRSISLIILTLIVIMVCTACGEKVAGTYYEWSYENEDFGKLVLAEDGKCLLYTLLAEGNEQKTFSGEYSESENGIMVFLDMGENFELTKENDYYIFDGNSDSRWYKDREKAKSEWEKVCFKNYKYIEDRIYYQCEYDPVFDTQNLLFLCITELESNGNAKYEIFISDSYDANSSENFNVKKLWENKKHSIEKGVLSLNHGEIISDSDYLANFGYDITVDGVVDSIFLNDEEYGNFYEWRNIEAQ